MVVIKGVVGSHGSSLASLIPLALQRSCGYKGTVNDWVRALGLALDESRWFAIYRLLNIFRMAGRRDTLSLPTSVHVERDGFSPPSPSTRLGGLPQILDSVMLICHCILTGTISAVWEWGPSAECLLMFRLHFCWPSLVPGVRSGTSLSWSLSWELVAMCIHVLSWCMCSTLGSCDTGYRIPQNCRFQPKALCLGHERAACGAAKPGLQADGGFMAPSLTLMALGSLNRGKLL